MVVAGSHIYMAISWNHGSDFDVTCFSGLGYSETPLPTILELIACFTPSSFVGGKSGAVKDTPALINGILNPGR